MMTEVKQLPQVSSTWPLGLPCGDSCRKLADISGRQCSGVLPCKVEKAFWPQIRDKDPHTLCNSWQEKVAHFSKASVLEINALAEQIGSEKDSILGDVLGCSGAFPRGCFEGQEGSLIPGLPDDVAKLCLALAPRLDFPAMSCVSRAWKALLQSKEFYLVRKSAGTLEEWLYALIQAPGSQKMRWQVLSPDCSGWKSLPPMPGPVKSGFGFVVVDGKLLVMGGSSEVVSGSNALAEVLKYDSALNRWSKVASMHTARYEFACAVLGGRVYVVGGHGEGGKNLSSVEVYDPQKNEWTHVPSLKRARWGCFACGLEGKIYVMGGRSSFTIGNSRCISVYDPSIGQWDEMKNGCVMVLAHTVLDKKLFCIEWKNDRKLTVYNAGENSWKTVPLPLTGSLSVGFCMGNLNGKILLFPKRTDSVCKTLVYDPNGTRGAEWQTSAIGPLGSCMCCATITA